eukprot:maker-scaffold142_size315517-snap-gene-2.22 protein:Tk07705 transcript:maker-scaffold142_size315517-snap-gene-2.22-mRNA-1 annotation:"sonic hedgehog protein"
MNYARVLRSCFIFLVSLVAHMEACGPGRGGIRRASRKLTPLVYKQHVPNFSEKSLAASGPFRAIIGRESQGFKYFHPNQNPDIVFKNEEQTGADRLMTRRCLEKLNTLAISVMNQWPGIQLRVVEAWDEDAHHSQQSLHYEGRAVDITTSDRDRSKYGLLARLAVEAGFDWVYYESKSHIHASCKNEATDSSMGGCFPARSWVRTRDGSQRPLEHLSIGEQVLSADAKGQLSYSPVITFLHQDGSRNQTFLRLTTDTGHSLTVTPKHLVFIRDPESATIRSSMAKSVLIGEELLIHRPGSRRMQQAKVTGISVVLRRGIYAPLTTHGTVLINDVLASSYSHIHSQSLAHWAFGPMRWSYLFFGQTAPSPSKMGPASGESPIPHDSIHWYARMLATVGSWFIELDEERP